MCGFNQVGNYCRRLSVRLCRVVLVDGMMMSDEMLYVSRGICSSDDG